MLDTNQNPTFGEKRIYKGLFSVIGDRSFISLPESLGEHLKICFLSTPEGHDKPIKYPEIFAASDAILVNKIDLMEQVDFNQNLFYESVQALNPHAPLFELSCRRGAGIED